MFHTIFLDNEISKQKYTPRETLTCLLINKILLTYINKIVGCTVEVGKEHVVIVSTTVHLQYVRHVMYSSTVARVCPACNTILYAVRYHGGYYLLLP